jgi:integrase
LDITMEMAVELVASADRFQLGWLAPQLLFGLRPGELGWMFGEHLDANWIRVPNIPGLDYVTKGRRNKQFPIVPCLAAIWSPAVTPRAGLLYVNRSAAEGRRHPPLLDQPLESLVDEYRRRCAAAASQKVSARRLIRDSLMRDAGQLTYDDVEGEFRKLADRLHWPRQATLKDLRHLFCTCLENAGVPEFYRRYLMGHSLGRAAIATYTHITEDKLQQHYARALATELSPIAQALDARIATAASGGRD